MTRFFLVLLAAALVMLGVVHMAYELQWISALPSFTYQTFIFLTFATGVLYIYLHKSRKSIFTQLYLFSITVKLLAYVGYNFFIVLEDRPGAFGNVVLFMVVYFVFTMLEIGFLYRKIRS